MEREAVRRSESSLPGVRGVSLFRRAWLPDAPSRAVLLVHGWAEHSGRYDEMATWLAERGCAVHGYDQRGHGRSGGARGHVAAFDDFLDDLEAMLAEVKRAHGDLPVFLVGHSMGGLVSAAFLTERAPELHGAVLSGPALLISDDLPRSRIVLARALRRLLPRLPMSSGLDPAGLSRDPEVVRRYLDDPLVHRKMTVSLASELLSAIARTAPRGDAVRVPTLVMHGEDDPICLPEGSRRFFEAVRSEGSALRIHPNLRHEIFNEPEREALYADVLAWLREREA